MNCILKVNSLYFLGFDAQTGIPTWGEKPTEAAKYTSKEAARIQEHLGLVFGSRPLIQHIKPGSTG